ncbi:MAG: nucleotide pyrophosphohydrolase [Pirellulaceae bacterium]|nr:nucleotide pyrophosphohydrolase [Pirellulaceae bacterium]
MACDDRHTTVDQLRQAMRLFVAERQWERFHNLKNLSMALAVEAAELMELTQWLTTSQVETGKIESGLQVDRSRVSEELADVLCYTLAIANAVGIDLSTAMAEKMVKNRQKYPIGSSF